MKKMRNEENEKMMKQYVNKHRTMGNRTWRMISRAAFLIFSFSHFLIFSISCSGPQLPEQFSEANVLPKIYPDYTDVTVPVNIAPLCFELLNEADEAVARFSAGDAELLVEGRKVRPDIDEWRRLTAQASGGSISVEVFAGHDGQWLRFKPFAIHVSPDSIDPWLSYRLISPSYVSYEELTINQRCLENFDEAVIADNMLCSTESGGQCINCHSFQNYNPQRMQLHARQTHGGTLIAYDGQLEKMPASLPRTPVYPAWHPTERLIAYSTNSTVQAFHTVDVDKIEVYDSQSALLLYDIDRQQMSVVEDLPDEMETFPAWAPDGRSLYYCSAHFEYEADSIDLEEVTLRAEELKYNIYRRSFDPVSRQFGERELVFCADSLPASATGKAAEGKEGGSATLPRISPDGRWLMFTMGRYGTFHIWHRDADLWMMELDSLRATPTERDSSLFWPKATDGQLRVRNMDELNSLNAESYHSWSSNGRWVVFSSRRHDGVFTRPFFAHIDEDGRGSKPFELPTADPDLHLQLLKSYNVPELMRGPVSLTPHQIAAKLKEE